MLQTQGASTFAALQGHQYVSLTTFRKSGQAVATPVWFALEGGTVYVSTAAASGKVKRIRNNARVQLAPSTQTGKPLGPSLDGVARLLAAGEEATAKNALDRKYGWLKRLFDFIWKLRGTEHAILEIVPA